MTPKYVSPKVNTQQVYRCLTTNLNAVKTVKKILPVLRSTASTNKHFRSWTFENANFVPSLLMNAFMLHYTKSSKS